MFPYLQFQLHRRWRKARRTFRIYRIWLVNYFYRHVWGKWRQLGIIRRFVMVWWGIAIVCLVALLNQTGNLQRFYLGQTPLPGGTFSEAIVGNVKTINPILPDSSASVDISRLVFSGLTRFNPSGKLEPDLAQSWQVSSDGLKYTFKLRPNVKWQDGVKFDASDVVFTITAIQHPDSRSPLATDWKGVKATAPDDNTVVLTLPNPYVGFLNLTTVGILPRHTLESIDPATLRVNNFNQQPIGTGPFKVKAFEPGNTATLVANPGYFRGRPKLDGVTLRFYSTPDLTTAAYSKRQVQAVARIDSTKIEETSKLKQLHLITYRTTEQTDLFFKTTRDPLKDKAVRQALTLATNRQKIIGDVLGNYVQPSFEPLLAGQIGYNAKYSQPRYNLAKAKQLLGGKKFKLELVTLDNDRLIAVANAVKQQWQQAGVDVTVKAVGLEDLIQSHIKPRDYQVLLYGITIGVDSDVYPYWHSSQINDPGLNLSQYQSTTADDALEVERIITDPDVRAGKYKTFLQTFVDDEPGVMLYTDNYYYAVSDDVKGVKPGTLSVPADRFYGIENWTVRTKPTILK